MPKNSRPRKLNTPAIINMFRLFADLIGRHIDGQTRFAQSEAKLILERESSELREQFIAVLGHGLRNPLGSIQAGTTLLRNRISDPSSLSIMDRMDKSVGRMSSRIDDVMDFARGRMGSGLGLYIAHEIARAHGGTLQATSTPDATVFTFMMRCRQ